MRGKWEKARGRIVESPDAMAGATKSALGGARKDHGYVAEVTGAGGQALRARVEMPGIFVRAVGEPIAVEVNFKTGEVRIDRHGMVDLLREQAQSELAAGRAARGQVSTDSSSARPVSGSPAYPSALPPGAFDTTGGAGSVQERLARLRQLLDSGILTESEYDSRRRDIVGQI
jgi:putative oligomerization/nucleic acid binding protein